MRSDDKVRIKEAINICEQFGNKLWKGIDKVPFVILLVSDSIEFLVNHPYPSEDFKLSENDPILKTKIYYRKAQFPKHFLATFPAVNGVNCIVVGTPENTGKSSSDWIVTLLHEHFHQYEYTSDNYYQSVNDLGLSGGDETGMWMLNYPFPYDSAVVMKQYTHYISALSKALDQRDTKDFDPYFKAYKTERKKFKKLLKPSDYSYFSFQVWQEGIARYTEYKFLELLVNYQPSAEVKALADFVPFPTFKEKFYQSTLKELNSLSLKEDRRICFYPIGFAEGLLVDRLNPKWRSSFLSEKFYIEKYSAEFD